MKDKNPISPHIQIYNWHISSLISISHRIVGIVNIIIVTLVCFWVTLLLLGKANYDQIQIFFETYIGKFFIVGTVWSFSFQALCEIRHLFWDLGYGFEIKTANISGLIVIVSSLILTVIVWLFARGFI